jgi:hypothetical protein
MVGAYNHAHVSATTTRFARGPFSRLNPFSVLSGNGRFVVFSECCQRYSFAGIHDPLDHVVGSNEIAGIRRQLTPPG